VEQKSRPNRETMSGKTKERSQEKDEIWPVIGRDSSPTGRSQGRTCCWTEAACAALRRLETWKSQMQGELAADQKNAAAEKTDASGKNWRRQQNPTRRRWTEQEKSKPTGGRENRALEQKALKNENRFTNDSAPGGGEWRRKYL
jgi:hypothetical protein